jgi:hypothetical protein
MESVMEKKIRELKLDEAQAVVGGATYVTSATLSASSYTTTSPFSKPLSWSTTAFASVKR